jgi:hypothetical protein
MLTLRHRECLREFSRRQQYVLHRFNADESCPIAFNFDVLLSKVASQRRFVFPIGDFGQTGLAAFSRFH